jgi:hypothetical protein
MLSSSDYGRGLNCNSLTVFPEDGPGFPCSSRLTSTMYMRRAGESKRVSSYYKATGCVGNRLEPGFQGTLGFQKSLPVPPRTPRQRTARTSTPDHSARSWISSARSYREFPIFAHPTQTQRRIIELPMYATEYKDNYPRKEDNVDIKSAGKVQGLNDIRSKFDVCMRKLRQAQSDQ